MFHLRIIQGEILCLLLVRKICEVSFIPTQFNLKCKANISILKLFSVGTVGVRKQVCLYCSNFIINDRNLFRDDQMLSR